jgi:hypothetical protein
MGSFIDGFCGFLGLIVIFEGIFWIYKFFFYQYVLGHKINFVGYDAKI